MGRAPRTKETPPNFLKWSQVTRYPLVFRELTGSQRTPGKWGITIGERSQIKEQDLNRQLCRRLNLGEDLDLGCRDRYREYRKPKIYKQPFRRKSRTFSRNQPFNTRYRKPRKYWIKRRRTNYSKNQCKCYLCGQVGHIKPECPELKKLTNERNRKTQIKINLIKEYEINSDNEELISELDFESDYSSIYSLEDEIEEFF